MVIFTYKNYRGKVSERKVSNAIIERGDSPYHGKDVLLLKAFDLDKQQHRDFLVSDIISWKY